jgi:endonuclease/exonuclease/phosphatase family metal-dependent hydrolase
MSRAALASASAVLRTLTAAGALLIASTGLASAQTTVTLHEGNTKAWSATVRGGSYANKNLQTILETRSSTDLEYSRRAMLKFDTQNTIPKGANVTSAIMTVTVKQGSEDSSRRLGAYQVTTSWDEDEITWKVRRTSTAWNSAGGDLGTKIAEATVGNAAGTKVSFDVTPLVRQAVAGSLGSSRYTRIALIDLEGSTNASWRAYYTSYDSNSAVRPTLKVTYSSGSSSAPAPAPAPSTSSGGQTLRILHYNIGKNGWGTDGIYDPNRIVNVIAKVNPTIISFNELEKFISYSKGLDGVAQYKALLTQKMGGTWYVWDAQDYGDWDGSGMHNAIFSRIPFSAKYRHIYSAGKLKTVGGVTINYNGRNINFMTTHFDPYSASYRATQARDLVAYMKGFAENRIVCGDFNDQPGDAPINTMIAGYYDAWAEAKKIGVAYAPPDNPAGNTRNSRLDYCFASRGEKNLTLKKAQVVETRDSDGDMPSDHRPLLVEYLVQ